MAASHFHFFFSHSVTSFQYVFPALLKNAIILLVCSLPLVNWSSWLVKPGASQMFLRAAPCTFLSIHVVVLMMLQRIHALNLLYSILRYVWPANMILQYIFVSSGLEMTRVLNVKKPDHVTPVAHITCCLRDLDST